MSVAGTKGLGKADRYRAGNIEADRLIAADPVKYPGVMKVWARLFIARHKPAPVTPAKGVDA